MGDSFKTIHIKDLEVREEISNEASLVVIDSSDGKITPWSSVLNLIKTKLASWAYNTLTTTDKTLPGAIEEVHKEVDELNTNFEITDFTSQCTVSDRVTVAKAVKYGKICFIIGNFASLASGAVSNTLRITSPYLPILNTVVIPGTVANNADIDKPIKLRYLTTGYFAGYIPTEFTNNQMFMLVYLTT